MDTIYISDGWEVVGDSDGNVVVGGNGSVSSFALIQEVNALWTRSKLKYSESKNNNPLITVI